jgi:serine/threonine-protein kinase
MLVFEFLDGGTLADRIRRAPLTAEQVVALGIALASALEHAHAAGILHGDIKPSNIGYQGTQGGGTPKLLDFGIARIMQGANRTAASRLDATSDGTTATAAPIGTLAYLSPEALEGESPDTSFDLWSLALVLLEALLGRNPFRGQATLDTVLSIDRAVIVDALATGPPCPSPLRAFFEAALARNPSRRPASATEFRRSLERCLLVATS